MNLMSPLGSPMARPGRYVLPDQPLQVIQRGNGSSLPRRTMRAIALARRSGVGLWLRRSRHHLRDLGFPLALNRNVTIGRRIVDVVALHRDRAQQQVRKADVELRENLGACGRAALQRLPGAHRRVHQAKGDPPPLVEDPLGVADAGQQDTEAVQPVGLHAARRGAGAAPIWT